MKRRLLKVERLRLAFRLEGRLSVPVRGVSLEIFENDRLALVGESGSGKSLTALSLGGLVQGAEVSGRIEGHPRLAYVFQNPMASLNPVLRIGRQIAEVTARSRVRELLVAVGLPPETERKFPCQLSGGQQQRAMIAMALAAEPELLIADEPTTALDVTTQSEVLALIDRLAAARQMAVLLITHNLALVAEHSERVHVMYAGEIVESGDVGEVLAHPRHPYTQGLLSAVPRIDLPRGTPLKGIPGTVPPPTDWPSGCAFHPRCPKRRDKCAQPDFAGCPEMEDR